MLDLAKNNFADQAEAGYEFELEHPATGEGMGAFIKVRGDRSRVVQAHARKRVTELQTKEKMAKRKGKDTDMSLDELEAMAIESAIVRVISWRGIAQNGEEIPFTKENAQEVFKEHSWIREQVMENAEQLLNFRSE